MSMTQSHTVGKSASKSDFNHERCKAKRRSGANSYIAAGLFEARLIIRRVVVENDAESCSAINCCISRPKQVETQPAGNCQYLVVPSHSCSVHSCAISNKITTATVAAAAAKSFALPNPSSPRGERLGMSRTFDREEGGGNPGSRRSR